MMSKNRFTQFSLRYDYRKGAIKSKGSDLKYFSYKTFISLKLINAKIKCYH